MPAQIATYTKAIKVTVDGPREPRSKIRHQGFHPFAFGPQRFPPDPLMAGLPFKLPGIYQYLNICLNLFAQYKICILCVGVSVDMSVCVCVCTFSYKIQVK